MSKNKESATQKADVTFQLRVIGQQLELTKTIIISLKRTLRSDIDVRIKQG
jgi:queuine/archaeosine tRNA-ribosyltransferase